MSQDFAKQRRPAQKNRQRSSGAAPHAGELKSTHWSWFLSGIGCGFLIVGIVYLGMIRLDEEPGETLTADTVAGDSQPVAQAINFDFYEELANAEVTVDVEPAPGLGRGSVQRQPEATAQTAALQQQDTTRYLLQAGSFQQREDAENRRVKVLLLNMDASVVPGVVSGRTWYRVQVGPFQGRRSAESARDLLSENNIDSIPLLMRD